MLLGAFAANQRFSPLRAIVQRLWFRTALVTPFQTSEGPDPDAGSRYVYLFALPYSCNTALSMKFELSSQNPPKLCARNGALNLASNGIVGNGYPCSHTALGRL